MNAGRRQARVFAVALVLASVIPAWARVAGAQTLDLRSYRTVDLTHAPHRIATLERTLLTAEVGTVSGRPVVIPMDYLLLNARR